MVLSSVKNPYVSAKAWCIMADNQILASKLDRTWREIASLTKIMTTYTAIKLCQLFNLDLYETMVTVPDECVKIIGTSALLCPGEVLSINDLLYGIMLPSGNDAAFTVANYLGE